MQKPVNSFLLFCKEHRSTIQLENPTYSNADVTSHLGKMWRAMRKEQKEKYVQRSRAISQKFKKENPTYTREPKEFEQYQFSFKVQSQGATKTIRKNSPVRRTPPTFQQQQQHETFVPVVVNVPVPQQCHTQYVHHSYNPNTLAQDSYYPYYPAPTETLDSSDIAFLSEFTFSR